MEPDLLSSPANMHHPLEYDELNVMKLNRAVCDAKNSGINAMAIP
jgi:hypothetical protein